jgi:hypothetical protein
MRPQHLPLEGLDNAMNNRLLTMSIEAEVLPLGDRVLTTSEDGIGMLWPVAPLLDVFFPAWRVQIRPAV